MPTLPAYTQFDGRYWDIGVMRNALDYQGVKAPHTGEPYTEAMLLGISGGGHLWGLHISLQGLRPAGESAHAQHI